MLSFHRSPSAGLWCIMYKAASVCFTLCLTLLSCFRHITAFISTTEVNQRGFILKRPPHSTRYGTGLFYVVLYCSVSPKFVYLKIFGEKIFEVFFRFLNTVLWKECSIFSGRNCEYEGSLLCCVTFRQHNCISNFSLRVITVVVAWCDSFLEM